VTIVSCRGVSQTRLIVTCPDVATANHGNGIDDGVVGAGNRDAVKPGLETLPTAGITYRGCHGCVAWGASHAGAYKVPCQIIALDYLGEGGNAVGREGLVQALQTLGRPDLVSFKGPLATNVVGALEPAEAGGQESIHVVLGIGWHASQRRYHLDDGFGAEVVDPDVSRLLDFEASSLAVVGIHTGLAIVVEPAVQACAQHVDAGRVDDSHGPRNRTLGWRCVNSSWVLLKLLYLYSLPRAGILLPLMLDTLFQPALFLF